MNAMNSMKFPRLAGLLFFGLAAVSTAISQPPPQQQQQTPAPAAGYAATEPRSRA